MRTYTGRSTVTFTVDKVTPEGLVFTTVGWAFPTPADDVELRPGGTYDVETRGVAFGAIVGCRDVTNDVWLWRYSDSELGDLARIRAARAALSAAEAILANREAWEKEEAELPRQDRERIEMARAGSNGRDFDAESWRHELNMAGLVGRLRSGRAADAAQFARAAGLTASDVDVARDIVEGETERG